jgi:hypothetical protein
MIKVESLHNRTTVSVWTSAKGQRIKGYILVRLLGQGVKLGDSIVEGLLGKVARAVGAV